MAHYRGRHAPARAAARRPARARHGLLGRPALLSVGIVAASAAAAVALPASAPVPELTAAESRTATAQAIELTALAEEDSSRLLTERAELNASRSAVRAEIEEQAAADAAAAKKEREERAERLAEERARKEAAQERADALELEAAQENPQRVAQILMPEFGFTGEGQWQCLANLWMGESDWRWWAENPTSGAYGIPQSLPADKMATAGDDWRTNPVTQIRWGLEYIRLSYGTPCGAWEFWQAQSPHWY